jgi:hypothetical protein
MVKSLFVNKNNQTISGFNNKQKSGFQTITQADILNDKYANELMKYDKLKHSIMDSFEIYVTYFKNGEFSRLDDTFNQTEAINLGQILVNNTLSSFTKNDINLFKSSGSLFSAYNPTEPLFPNYKSFMHLLIDGLNSAILLDKQNTQCSATNSELQKYRTILTDVELLKQYIEDNYNNFSSSLINVDMTTNTSLNIKLEYTIYINRYGIPTNGIFDSEKLNNIILEIS